MWQQVAQQAFGPGSVLLAGQGWAHAGRRGACAGGGRTFFMATVRPLGRCVARYTLPYVPSPILAPLWYASMVRAVPLYCLRHHLQGAAAARPGVVVWRAHSLQQDGTEVVMLLVAVGTWFCGALQCSAVQ